MIEKFFEFVNRIKPAAWAFENVRQVASYIDKAENIPRGYRVSIINGTMFGVPQNRVRCIVSNIDGFTPIQTITTLRDVVHLLPPPGDDDNNDVVVMDPYYNVPVPMKMVSDHDLHAVSDRNLDIIKYKKGMTSDDYGRMTFPDRLDRPCRTIVGQPSTTGREVIVILDDRYNPPLYRYLSLRERALTQGFPLWYDFGDLTKRDKMKAIGNAFPPPMASSVMYSILKYIVNGASRR